MFPFRLYAATGDAVTRLDSVDGTSVQTTIVLGNEHQSREGHIVNGVMCLAGLNDDPVCKHRAAFYLLIGVITLTPEPDPPALGATMDCPECNGCGVHYSRELERRGLLYPTYRRCHRTGGITVPALRPAA